MNKIVVRKIRKSDSESVIAIAKSLPEWFTKAGIRHINTDSHFQSGFIADDSSKVVAFLLFFVYESIGYISWMGVLPEFHRMGIGKKLVAVLCNKLKLCGISEIRVNTLDDSVEYEPYERTCAFYRGIGFTDFERKGQDNHECPAQLTLRKII